MAGEYEVLSIDELHKVGDTGQMERYYRHRIKTKGGVRFTVDVDEATWTAKEIAPVLLARVQEADKIKALTG